MFSAARALSLSADAGKPLPHIDGLEDLYKVWTPREGQLIMIAGRSGTLKSGFAMFLCAMWNRPTLYFSGDMSAKDASTRLASIVTERSSQLIDTDLEGAASKEALLARLGQLQVNLVPESPITFKAIDEEILAWVELHNSYPEVICVDNFMDIDSNQSDYAAQMESFQWLTSIARTIGATLIVLHHATDKSRAADGISWTRPPSRSEIKNGMSEKPEIVLTVAVDLASERFQVAVVKQRSGKSDPGAIEPVSLRVTPSHFRFTNWSL